MDTRRIALTLVLVTLVIVSFGCKPDPSEIDHFVVALKAPPNLTGECWVYPGELVTRDGVKWIIVTNYSPPGPSNTVKVEIKDTFAKIDQPTLTVQLAPGESTMFELKSGLPSGSIHPFQVTGGSGGCLTGFPNPRIVIP
jgi:hypothetical protein